MKRKEDVNEIIENWNETSISGYTIEPELRQLVKQICEEIDNSSIIESELVEILVNLPSILTEEILFNTKFKKDDNVRFLLYSKYFDQFVKDINKTDKKGVTFFEKRLTKQMMVNKKQFLDERLLTKYELDLLLYKLKEKDPALTKYSVANLKRCKSKNKYVKALVNANSALEKRHTMNDDIMRAIVQPLLLQTLDEIRALNIKCDYE